MRAVADEDIGAGVDGGVGELTREVREFLDFGAQPGGHQAAPARIRGCEKRRRPNRLSRASRSISGCRPCRPRPTWSRLRTHRPRRRSGRTPDLVRGIVRNIARAEEMPEVALLRALHSQPFADPAERGKGVADHRVAGRMGKRVDPRPASHVGSLGRRPVPRPEGRCHRDRRATRPLGVSRCPAPALRPGWRPRPHARPPAASRWAILAITRLRRSRRNGCWRRSASRRPSI